MAKKPIDPIEDSLNEAVSDVSNVAGDVTGAATDTAKDVQNAISDMVAEGGPVETTATGEAAATPADVRKALEDLVAAIEKQQVFADVRKALDEARGALEGNQAIGAMRQAVQDTAAEIQRHPFREMVQKVFYAGLGATAMTRDELNALLGKMVQRGEVVESETKEMADEVSAKRQQQLSRLQEEVDKRVRQILSSVNMPSSADIEDLNAKIAALQRRVEELSTKTN
jgi:polyhydroxyalkanoate synthesis regulator phasin